MKRKKTHAESVAAHIVRADRQVANLEALNSMNIEALINNTSMGCNGVTLSWRHAARAKAVPGCLDVTGNCNGVRHYDPTKYQLKLGTYSISQCV